jgi:peptide chain release factor subunit 3
MGTVGWKEDRFKHIQTQVSPFLENSCGFNKVVFIPVESIENVNIHTRIPDSWYKGPSLLEYLDNVGLPERKPLGPLRIPVIDKFKEQGNFYIYGKIESGSIVEDQVVTLLPQRTPISIKEIYNAKDQRLPFACAG